MRQEATIQIKSKTWKIERSFHWVAMSDELSVPEYRFLLYCVEDDDLMILKGIGDLAIALHNEILTVQHLPPEGPSSPFWLMKARPAAYVAKFQNFPQKLQADWRKWAEKEREEGVLRLFRQRMKGEVEITKHLISTLKEN